MLNIDTGEEIPALFKFYDIRGGKKYEKFKTTDIDRAIKFHKWYVARYQRGLFMEILPEKTVYIPKERKVIKTFE